MPHYVALYLDFHFLPKYLFAGIQNKIVIQEQLFPAEALTKRYLDELYQIYHFLKARIQPLIVVCSVGMHMQRMLEIGGCLCTS